MQVPYQQLAAPQVAVYSAAVPAASAHACCPCCVEPNCCSRVGACPCFCTGYTAAFSLALCSMWLALPMLVCAMAITDFFEVSLYGDQFLFLGMWQACGWFDASYDCTTYSNDKLDEAFNGANQFNALRALTLVGTTFTLIAAILASIRLARQQRSKPNSACLNTSTLLSAIVALASTGTSFGLSFPLIHSLDDITSGSFENMTTTTWGLSWIFLVVGVGLMVIGVLLHLLAHCCYQSNVVNAAVEEEGEQPGLYAASYPTASIFSHPQPLHAAVVPAPIVYYPTASALHYPPPQYSQQPPMGHIYQ